MTELGVSIAIDLRVAGLTLRLVDPLIDPTVAIVPVVLVVHIVKMSFGEGLVFHFVD